MWNSLVLTNLQINKVIDKLNKKLDIREDEVLGRQEGYEISCPCCRKCWFVVRGKQSGKCVHGGPYGGYINEEESGSTDT